MILALEKFAKGLADEEQSCVERLFSQVTESVEREGVDAAKVPSEDKVDRGYIDGAYDLCHSGHFNAIR